MTSVTGAEVEPDLSPAEIARVERVKAEMAAAKERARARGGPVLAKKFARPDDPAEPGSDAAAARLAISSFRKATGGDGRGVRHDADALERIARDNPGTSQGGIRELYRAQTGRSITAITTAKILRGRGVAPARARRGPGPKADSPAIPRPQPQAAAPRAEAPPSPAAPPAVREASRPRPAPAEGPSPALVELDAMRGFAEVLEQLPAESRRRVLAWVGWHYGAEG
jgi:hypothetical protein